MTLPLRPGRLRRSPLAALPLLLGLATALPQRPAAAQQALFGALEVEQQRFVLVAAPIGSSGNRYQLNIYEQINDRRPCFATESNLPSAVNPLLATFDFTGICGRYIDANGYSLRVGGTDLATSYRLMVRTESGGTVLVALPTKSGAGPEMVVARSGGLISGFHKLQPEPGWRLMRRTYGGRRLGHLYVYNDSWPVAATGGTTPATAGAASAPAPAATTPAGAAPSPAPQATPTSSARPALPAASGTATSPPAASSTGQGAAGRPGAASASPRGTAAPSSPAAAAGSGNAATGGARQTPATRPGTGSPAATPLSSGPSAPVAPPPRL